MHGRTGYLRRTGGYWTEEQHYSGHIGQAHMRSGKNIRSARDICGATDINGLGKSERPLRNFWRQTKISRHGSES